MNKKPNLQARTSSFTELNESPASLQKRDLVRGLRRRGVLVESRVDRRLEMINKYRRDKNTREKRQLDKMGEQTNTTCRELPVAPTPGRRVGSRTVSCLDVWADLWAVDM